MYSLNVHKEICYFYTRHLLSAPEISTNTGVPLKRVYAILERNGIARRAPAQQNKRRFDRSESSFSIKNNLSIQEEVLLTAALMLYCGEGAKTGYTVDFANASPDLHKVFLSFLRRVCQINENRLKFYLYCFSNQDVNKLICFWSETLHVSKKQFTKPYIKSSPSISKRNLKYGVLHTRYSDKRLLKQILEMCNEITFKVLQN